MTVPFFMSFKQLYERVQDQGDRISTKWLRSQVIEISPIKAVKEFWSGAMDHSNLRGFYIEGPFTGIPALALGENEALIGLSRSMCNATDGKNWRRAVLTKELMHCFDTDEEKADTPEKLELQVERFSNPKTPSTPQFRAESTAFWRSLAVLCKDDRRRAFKADLEANRVSWEVVATSLGLPLHHVRFMMRHDFEEIILDLF